MKDLNKEIQALADENQYSIIGWQDLQAFLQNKEIVEVVKYAYSESEEREVKLTAGHALSLMLRNYREMRRKAWSGEQVLSTVEAIIQMHGNRSATNQLPEPEQWPTYPEYEAAGIIPSPRIPEDI